MRGDAIVTSTIAQQFSLLLLRVSTGFLLIWSGLAKIVKAKAPFALRSMELSDTMNAVLGYAAGGAQLVIGVLCVIGLWRRYALSLQALIHGFTAISVWWAIIDPYRWYITGVDRIVFNSHVFYPTSITFAACIVLIAFRHRDRIAVDTLLDKAPPQVPQAAPTEENQHAGL
ncbi:MULTISPECIES: DoxX family protein [unclassified Roseovarius]|uniref:DoxX family protein n=1 Tax=unclassified Roseovarius TaxID=2614913 RepID=UPI00273EE3E7|nr:MULTISPECIES: DoxX family protein [unclassified Roseovarius]